MSNNAETLEKEQKKEEEETEDNKYLEEIEKLNDYQVPHKYLFRMCILGDSGVGKTSLLTRFVDNSFKENNNNTIGVDYRLVSLKYKDIVTKIHIWDTAGQERFRSLALNYLNKAQGFIFVYDITDKSSFQNTISWIKLALEKNKNAIINFLIGNKIDMENERKIPKEEAEQLAKENNLYYLEASAKNDENVKKIFYYFAYKLIQYFDKNGYVEETKLELNKTQNISTNPSRGTEKNCNC